MSSATSFYGLGPELSPVVMERARELGLEPLERLIDHCLLKHFCTLEGAILFVRDGAPATGLQLGVFLPYSKDPVFFTGSSQ